MTAEAEEEGMGRVASMHSSTNKGAMTRKKGEGKGQGWNARGEECGWRRRKGERGRTSDKRRQINMENETLSSRCRSVAVRLLGGDAARARHGEGSGLSQCNNLRGKQSNCNADRACTCQVDDRQGSSRSVMPKWQQDCMLQATRGVDLSTCSGVKVQGGLR